MPVIAVCSLKSGGSSTLALTLASVAAASGQAVELIDAAANNDIGRWAVLPGCPPTIRVASCKDVAEMEALIRAGLTRQSVVVVDAGLSREVIRMASRFADVSLIPVRFSPVAAYWASQTDRLLEDEALDGRPRRHAFVATAVAQIPSRIARSVEALIDRSAAVRLPAGLALRAAFEAPFLLGGTIFSLPDDAAPGLGKAQLDALAVARELAVLTQPFSRMRAPRFARPRQKPGSAFSSAPGFFYERATDGRLRLAAPSSVVGLS